MLAVHEEVRPSFIKAAHARIVGEEAEDAIEFA